MRLKDLDIAGTAGAEGEARKTQNAREGIETEIKRPASHLGDD